MVAMSDRPMLDETESFLDRMNREFRDAARRWDAGTGSTGTGVAAPADVVDREESFEVTVELPGFGVDDVEVELLDRTLSVTADAEESATDEGGTYVRRERRRRSVSQRIELPDAVEPGDATASLDEGVLTVTVPKAAGAERGTSIDIA